MIKINNVEKTKEEWLLEFDSIGRPAFYKLYGILNKRLLWEAINKAEMEVSIKP